MSYYIYSSLLEMYSLESEQKMQHKNPGQRLNNNVLKSVLSQGYINMPLDDNGNSG